MMKNPILQTSVAISNSPASPILHIQVRLTICQLLRKLLLPCPLFGYGTANPQTSFLSPAPNNFNQLHVHEQMQCPHLFATPPHQSVTLKTM